MKFLLYSTQFTQLTNFKMASEIDMMAEESIGKESDAKEEARPLSDAHCSKVMLKATKGKNRDKVIMHYKYVDYTN
jgi:hypothetical protein